MARRPVPIVCTSKKYMRMTPGDRGLATIFGFWKGERTMHYTSLEVLPLPLQWIEDWAFFHAFLFSFSNVLRHWRLFFGTYTREGEFGVFLIYQKWSQLFREGFRDIGKSLQCKWLGEAVKTLENLLEASERLYLNMRQFLVDQCIDRVFCAVYLGLLVFYLPQVERRMDRIWQFLECSPVGVVAIYMPC